MNDASPRLGEVRAGAIRRFLGRCGFIALPSASARRTVSLPDPSPQQLAALQSRCDGWSLMWSRWRRAYTAFARFGATPAIIDDADPARLLERCRRFETAVAYGRVPVA